MAAIIHAPTVAAAGRQLRRPGMVAAAGPASVPGTPVAAAAAVMPVAGPVAAPADAEPLLPAPSALQEDARRLREQAAQLEARAQALAHAETALQQQQQALAQQAQQLNAAQQQLQDESAAICEQAEQRGHAQGLQRGEDAAHEAAAAQRVRLNTLVQALEHGRQAWLEQHEDMLVEISFAAICRILGAQAASRAGLASQVRSLVAGERALEQLRVRLHPQDLQLLAADRGELDARLQLEADHSIGLGGCLIDGPRGTLDARLELQIQQLRAALVLARSQREAAV
ncbi:hypothetical protein GTP58_28155 [Duganella sp. CY15W]|uniref:FliH/SctL family protein n=1 Tax=Duganella sp. CY15W TaxID=2692172 RepID=UPI0013686DF9|nr:FliH/SctL family protein [Duganella sp. CY15W]MYM32214.1 hypothetical protein [Duganella sp. CY15W]